MRSRDRADALFADSAAYRSEHTIFDRDRALAIGGYALGAIAISAGVYLLTTRHAQGRAVDVALVPGGAMLTAAWSLR